MSKNDELYPDYLEDKILKKLNELTMLFVTLLVMDFLWHWIFFLFVWEN